jgi:signal transduction histidine kinase/ActR/RegA family two-component response regulator
VSEFLKQLFSSNFMPHGYCYLWKPAIVWLHAMSDATITLAYYTIPVALFYFVRKRRDLPFHWMFLMFGVFIFGCGTTHLMEIWTLWHGTYLLSGAVKAATAVASLATAALMVPLVPRALALPSPAQLRAANHKLEQEVRERRRIQEALERAERLAHVGNWHWNIKANQIYWSDELFRIFGKPQEYLPSYEGFLQAVVPEDRQRVERWVRDWLAEKSGSPIEFQVVRPNGDKRTLICTPEVSLDKEGLPERMFGSCQDITDFRNAQREDFARQNLENLGTLASGIAHDFNNLLGGVLAQADLALAELADGSSPEEEVKRIREVAIRSSEIVRQLMIYAGKESEPLGPVDVSRTVEEMLELLRVSASKHAALETDLAEDLPAVRASAAQIRQIIMNLVINSSEAIGETDGVIRVTTERVTVGGDRSGATPRHVAEGDYVELEVSDTGRGMSLETQARVFDPFFTTKSAGHGLGLAVVNGIVRALHGAIQLASEPGTGSTFQILLPCAETTAGAADDPMPCIEKPVHSSRAATVLVVEDEDPLRQAVIKVLSKNGYSVIEASDGSTALKAMRAHRAPIDVLVLDISLPGTPSREVFEEARRLRPEMRVIVTSAYGADVAAASLQVRIERFIRKPYSLGNLVDLIRQAVTAADEGRTRADIR